MPFKLITIEKMHRHVAMALVALVLLINKTFQPFPTFISQYKTRNYLLSLNAQYFNGYLCRFNIKNASASASLSPHQCSPNPNFFFRKPNIERRMIARKCCPFYWPVSTDDSVFEGPSHRSVTELLNSFIL